jgi:uncharacterized RDD family membrane protein YckC
MYCSKCGTTIADGAAFCGSCGQSTGAVAVAQVPVAVQPPPPPAAAAATGVLYAGFWLRVVAAIIDNLVLVIPVGFLYVFVFASAIPMLLRGGGGNPMAAMMLIGPRILLMIFAAIVVRWLYWATMESSEWQATLGKKALGLYVTDMEGRRTTFGRTSGRFFAGRGLGVVTPLGGLYYFISCIMVGFTEKKQALHDMIANCLVLRKA